ncbi:MAG: peptidoglycan-binding domain-containing protein, partial [Acidimicrobiia bacterium]
EVQEALVAAGVYDAADVDGVFGPQTEDAVSDFQRQVGLVESGVVDDATAVGLGLFVAGPAATDTVAAEAGSADAVKSDDSLEPAAVPPPLADDDAAAGGDGVRAVSDRASGGVGVGAWWLLLALLLVATSVLVGWRRARRPTVVPTDPVEPVRASLYDHDREDESDVPPVDDGLSLRDWLRSS